MKDFDVSIVIGRFSPFHNAHLTLVDTASKIAKQVIIVVGSHNCPISLRNPWNTDDRKKMIMETLKENDIKNCQFVEIPDSAYNSFQWENELRKKVYPFTKNKKVTIVGHFRDDTSFYLNNFPEWILTPINEDLYDNLSSTKIRKFLYESELEKIKPSISNFTYKFIVEQYEQGYFDKLIDENDFVEAYKNKWKVAPFPPVFVTTDAVVFHTGHVLLVKRKMNPGKGRFALPGGFLKQDETIENCCVRELYEETKLDVAKPILRTFLKTTAIFEHPLRDPRGRVITHAYMFNLKLSNSLPKIKGSDDAEKAFWFPLNELEEKENEFFSDHAQIIKYFVNRMN